MNSIQILITNLKKQKEIADLSISDKANIESIVSQLGIVEYAILFAEKINHSGSTQGYTITWESSQIVRVSAHNPSSRYIEGLFYQLYNSRLDDYLKLHLKGYIGREKQRRPLGGNKGMSPRTPSVYQSFA